MARDGVFYPDVPSTNYADGSVNKLQNGAISLILIIGKISYIHFVGNLILNVHRNFFVHRTQPICVLFSAPVFCHNSQVINSIGTRDKMNKLTS